MRRKTIPAARLRALSRGEAASATAQEWQALDMGTLLAQVLREAGAPAPDPAWLDMVRALPVARRVEAIALHLLDRHAELREAFADHPSDTVRIWAALMAGHAPKRGLAQRLEELRPFAADAHPGVRDHAALAFRPHLAAELGEGLALLEAEAQSGDEHLRRFAAEASRPRGGTGWAHLQALKQQPELARGLLEALKADPSRAVQTSVALWLADAAKDQPAWVLALAKDWEAAPSPHTQWILAHGLRELRKRQAWGLS